MGTAYRYGNDFNPRTHEECDLSVLPPSGFGVISIHALTRSATRLLTSSIRLNPKFQSTHSRGVRRLVGADLFDDSSLFQSTHSRGVRREGALTDLNNAYIFQSTHSRGVRLLSVLPPSGFGVISIHALTRSATRM